MKSFTCRQGYYDLTMKSRCVGFINFLIDSDGGENALGVNGRCGICYCHLLEWIEKCYDDSSDV